MGVLCATDHGESVKVSELRNATSPRNGYQQVKCKRIKNGLPTDDGGHLIASRFGGTGEQINYVPMPRGLNRSGIWYNLEEMLASKMYSGVVITNIKIVVIYIGNSKKPDSFLVSWQENGISNPDVDGLPGNPKPIPNR